MSSQVANAADCANYLLQCRRFLEAARQTELPKLAPLIIRIIECFSDYDESSSTLDAMLIDNMIQDARYCDAVITTISCSTSFTCKRDENFTFRFSKKDCEMHSNEIVSQSKTFAYALASSFIHLKYLEYMQMQDEREAENCAFPCCG